MNSLPKSNCFQVLQKSLKHALIADKNYWESIKNTPFQEMNWESIIHQSVVIKNTIVNNDPMEQGERKKLNFGHTIGHAVESHYLAKGNPILHGEAIALGILEECKLSSLSEKEKEEINAFITTCFPSIKLPSTTELIKWMKQDKKNSSSKINFTLLSEIGDSLINQEFEVDELLS